VEHLADRPIALVAGEEAVEKVGTRLAERFQRPPDVQREIELRERLDRTGLDVLGRLDARALAQTLYAQFAGELF
jgi:hypothetical protein